MRSTVDGRGSKGALHMYNKFNMQVPSNMFVVEYASRPDLASIFYEDVLMCSTMQILYKIQQWFGSEEFLNTEVRGPLCREAV